jgi:hypothetical protein
MRTVRVGEVLRCSGNTMAGFGDRVLKVVQLTAKQLGRSPPARKRMKARNVLPHRLPRPKLKASAACGHDHRGQVVQITRRWGMCCNVSPLEADCQIAGYWLPRRNDLALNRQAARVALRQGSLRVGQRADPHPPGGVPCHRKRDSYAREAPGRLPLVNFTRLPGA